MVYKSAICFNTQPPEGGWLNGQVDFVQTNGFQHTAARRRLVNILMLPLLLFVVSTHSRPKAAGSKNDSANATNIVSTHSRPKAAGHLLMLNFTVFQVFQHTAARRRLALILIPIILVMLFQHTAARRRLEGKDKQVNK